MKIKDISNLLDAITCYHFLSLVINNNIVIHVFKMLTFQFQTFQCQKLLNLW